MSAQFAPAIATDGETLQKRAAFSHRAAPRCVRPGTRISGNARAIGFICGPIDVAFMVVLDKHLPFGNRQLPDSLLAKPGCVERDFEAALAIGVGACVHRVRQNMIDRNVTWVDPTNGRAIMFLQWKRRSFGSQMKPDAARRAQFSETDKDVADRGAHGFVGMEAYLAILLAPDEADEKTTTQFAASGFVADASVETFP